jgi:hypothetical protein
MWRLCEELHDTGLELFSLETKVPNVVLWLRRSNTERQTDFIHDHV